MRKKSFTFLSRLSLSPYPTVYQAQPRRSDNCGQLEMQEIRVTLEEPEDPDALGRAPPPNDERG
jgi:hypothetical protein